MRDVQTDLGKLRGEITELRVANDLVSADLARLLAEVRSEDGRSGAMQDVIRETAADLARLRTRLQAAEDELRQSRAAPPVRQPTAGVVTAAPPPAALPAATDVDRPRESLGDEPAAHAYSAALTTFRAREHGQAVLDFMDFIAKYPSHPLAANAQYWIGEAYYLQRDHGHALVEYQRVIQMAPRTAKAADALVKIGMCHATLRNPVEAVQAWQRVVREYPRSEAAGKARSLLRARASSQP